MSDAKEVVTIDDISEKNAPAIYVKGGLLQFLEAVKVEVTAEVPDLTTRKGRDRIASLAAKVSKSKVAVEKPGREYLARLKEMPKVVEAELREFVRSMDALRDETRAPLTAWEEAEEARVADHQAGLESLRNTLTEGASAAMIQSLIADMESEEIGADWEEFEAEAHRVKAASLATLREALLIREKHEAELAAIAKFQTEQAGRERKEREECIAREAAEAERLAAEQRAQAERDAAAQRERDAQAAAERRELELKLQAQQAERQAKQAELDKIAAEKKAEQDRIDAEARHAEALLRAQEDERRRQKAEAERLEAEAKAREADRAHKGATLKAAKEAIMKAGITEEQAVAVVKMIAAGKVPAVSIQY